jgi:hypothetical protein
MSRWFIYAAEITALIVLVLLIGDPSRPLGIVFALLGCSVLILIVGGVVRYCRK